MTFVTLTSRSAVRAAPIARFAHMPATKQAHPGFDPMLALIRSSLSPTTGAKIREVIDEQVIAPMAERLVGPDAEARAALLMSDTDFDWVDALWVWG